MNPDCKIDFATFCHNGDVHRLHAPGQFKRQVESNNYPFNNTHILYQKVDFKKFDYQGARERLQNECDFNIDVHFVADVEWELEYWGIDVYKEQYKSNVDRAHEWEYHVVNHISVVHNLVGIDYIVFADNDCWMVEQLEGYSWVEHAKGILDSNPDIFIVSPNDGEPERRTNRFSQQMFMARVEEFKKADFNQPGWDGNVNVPDGPLPEYWAMLEGRMQLYCRTTGQCRYVLGPEFRYWHHRLLTKEGMFETVLERY